MTFFDIPKLLNEVRALRAENKLLKEQIRVLLASMEDTGKIIRDLNNMLDGLAK
jgi:hypothetical protein